MRVAVVCAKGCGYLVVEDLPVGADSDAHTKEVLSGHKCYGYGEEE